MIRRILALALLLWVLGFVGYAVTLARPAGDVRTDAIVVPTGGPGRIDRGLMLMETRAARRMLITGVGSTVRPADLAATYRAPRALFTCCIDLGQEAVDTQTNAEETAAWVMRHDFRSVRLVTTDWHMARARLELRRALPDEVTILADGVPSAPALSVLLREYNKLLLRRGAMLVGL